MNSKKIFVIGAVIALLLGVSKTGVGQEKATPQEVVQKVRQAADFLSKSGDAGLAQFNQKNGPWVWKDSYLFVFDCAKGTVAGHPFRPDLIGKNGTGLKGNHGIEFFPKLCKARTSPSGVWVEYWWPKPNEKHASRKVSYGLKVANTPYIVAAGIYDDKAKIADLEKLISAGK